MGRAGRVLHPPRGFLIALPILGGLLGNILTASGWLFGVGFVSMIIQVIVCSITDGGSDSVSRVTSGKVVVDDHHRKLLDQLFKSWETEGKPDGPKQEEKKT